MTIPAISFTSALRANAKPMVIGGVLSYILITKPHDSAGMALFGGLALFFFGMAAWRTRNALNAPPVAEGVEMADGVSHLPPDEQVGRVERLRLIAVVTTFAFGIWAYFKLTALERGEPGPERLWAPIAWLYNTLGLWPAVLVLPLVGVGVWIAGGKMIERAESTSQMIKPGEAP